LRINLLEHEQALYGKLVNLVQAPIVGPARFLGVPEAGTFLVDGVFGEDWWPLVPTHLELARREFAAAREGLRARIGKLSVTTHLIPYPTEVYRTLADPFDTAQDLDRRARSYLHANCSECHVPAGGGNAMMDLDSGTPKATTNVFDAKPQHALFGIADARLVPSGDPDRSVLLYRMEKLGGGRMPRVGSNEVDERGVRLIHDWIASLRREEPPAEDEEACKAFTAYKEYAERVEKIRREQQADVEVLARSVGNAKDCTAAIDRLLHSTDGAMALLAALDADRVPTSLRSEIIARATNSPQADVRELYERFTPLASRIQRLGESPDTAALLAIDGSAARGKQLFFAAGAVECKSCHRIGPGPDLVGPDLSHIGKKSDKRQLLESLLEPSKTIEPKYQAWLVATSDGKVFSGILLSKTDAQIVLKDAKNQEIRLATDDVESLAPQAKSLMPDLLLRNLTAEQAADLLAYLASLK
jgi:putative heme-binding domain-containing protein